MHEHTYPFAERDRPDEASLRTFRAARPLASDPQPISPYSPYSIYMGEAADKRIPVTREVWEDLSDLKRPGETFAGLLAEMIEHEKKRPLFLDMERIEGEGNFVELRF